MTHKTKECLSRPRKHGARWTGRDIQADERVDSVKLGWDAKRDRWNGYDSREYDAVVQEYEDMETLRQTAAKSKTPGEQQESTGEDGEPSTTEDDTARYAEETDMGRSQPTSTRQLRLREDTAKYLLDLNLDSAKYDPKTRTMDIDASALQPTQTGEFDGFIRPTSSSGDAAAFERAQRYAWETQEGNAPTYNRDSGDNSAARKLHLQANPTEGELLMKKKTTEDAERKAAHRKALIEKYGEAALASLPSPSDPTNAPSHSNSKPKPKPVPTSSTAYVEYDRFGQPKLPSGALKPVARSKYPEDILTNNHTSVWGSHWDNFTWGYACCHSTVRNSYCTGEEGKQAFHEAEGMRTGEILVAKDTVGAEEAQKLRQEQEGEDIQERKDGENADTTRNGEGDSKPRSSKRAFAEVQGGVTEEEMEAYKRNKMAADDPMRHFVGLEDGV